MKTKIFFVTTNHNKYLEACSIFRNSDFLIIHKEDTYHEIQSNDLESIVRYGLKSLSTKSIYPIMIEDSGLFIKNLNDFPGPYSSYIFNTLGNSGLLKLMNKIKDRQAVFKSVLGYSTSSSIKIFEGDVSGKITTKQRLFQETYYAVRLATHINPLLEKINHKIEEIHSDLNPDPNYISSTMISQCLGYIQGMGFKGRIKPYSWAASSVADLKSR